MAGGHCPGRAYVHEMCPTLDKSCYNFNFKVHSSCNGACDHVTHLTRPE